MDQLFLGAFAASRSPLIFADLISAGLEAEREHGDEKRFRKTADQVLARGEQDLQAEIVEKRRMVEILQQAGPIPPLQQWLDDLIAVALRLEQEKAADYDRIGGILEQAAALLERRRSSIARQMREWLDRFRAITSAYLTALRDLRWELMALRSDSDQPSDRPVFGDAAKLRAHLTELMDTE